MKTWKVPFGQGDRLPRLGAWPERQAEPLMRYAEWDAKVTMRFWAEYMEIEAERVRRRWHRIAAVLTFAALLTAVIVEVLR